MMRCGWLIAPIATCVLWAVPADAATYYVSKSGSDANSCATATSTTQASQKLTINAGLACLSAGDTLVAHGGTYVETVNAANAGSGTNWTTGAINVQAAVPELVIVRPTNLRALFFDTVAYHIWTGINLDCQDLNSTPQGCAVLQSGHHIRIQDSYNANSYWSGIETSQSNCGGDPTNCGTYYEFINIDIRDGARCGLTCDGSHGIYITGNSAKTAGLDLHMLVERCRIHGFIFPGKTTDSGLDVYAGTGAPDRVGGITIRRNDIYGNAQGGFYAQATTVPIVFESNIYRDNQNSGLVIFQQIANAKIYNNTIHGNGAYGIEIGPFGSATGIVARNNALTNNAAGPIVVYNASGSSAIDARFNLLNGNGNGNAVIDQNSLSTFSNNLTSAPGYTSAAAHDFTLAIGSALIDAGTTVAAVTQGFDGTSRPQGSAYDIGAYELDEGDEPPVDPPPPTPSHPRTRRIHGIR